MKSTGRSFILKLHQLPCCSGMHCSVSAVITCSSVLPQLDAAQHVYICCKIELVASSALIWSPKKKKAWTVASLGQSAKSFIGPSNRCWCIFAAWAVWFSRLHFDCWDKFNFLLSSLQIFISNHAPPPLPPPPFLLPPLCTRVISLSLYNEWLPIYLTVSRKPWGGVFSQINISLV